MHVTRRYKSIKNDDYLSEISIQNKLCFNSVESAGRRISVNSVTDCHLRFRFSFLVIRTISSAGGLPDRRVRRGRRDPCLPGRREGHSTVAG